MLQRHISKKSFAQHVRVIFLVLAVERVTADDTLLYNIIIKHKFQKDEDDTKAFASFLKTAKLDRTQAVMKAEAMMCQPFLKLFQSYVS